MAGYSRQSTSDIVPTAVVKAAPINAEYNKLRDAFTFSSSATTGHRHDGDSDEGSYVPLIADPDALNKIVVDTSNNRHGVFVEVGGAAVEQIRISDGLIAPVTDSDVDLGGSTLEFKDLYLDGTAHIDTLDVDESAAIGTTLTVTGVTALNGGLTMDSSAFTVADTSGNTAIAGTLAVTGATTLAATSFGDANITNVGNIALDSITADGSTITITGNTTFADGAYDFDIASHDTSNGLKLGGTLVTATAAEINILDGVTSTAAELNLLDGVTSTTAELNILDGVTATTAELNILDGVTATAAELNILDGVTSTATELNLLDGVTATTTELNYNDTGAAVGTVVASKTVTADANKDVTGLRNVTASGNIIIGDGANIGSASDTDAIAIASGGDVTVSQNLLVSGNLTVTGTQTVVDTVTMNAANALVFEGATADDYETTLTIVDPTADRTINLPNQSGTLALLDAASNVAITSTPAELNILDGVTATTAELNILDGVTSTATELNLLDGVTATTAELNYVDGVTSAIQTQLNTKGVTAGSSSIVTTGALNSGSITSGFGTIDTGSSAITTTGAVTFGSLNDGTIGVTAFVDEDNMASNSATLVPTQQSVKAYVDTVAGAANNVVGLTASGDELNILDGATVTTAELNILDGSATTQATVTLVGTDGVVISDADVMKQALVSDFDTYMATTTKTLTNKTLTSPTLNGTILVSDGSNDLNIASHDGSNGLKLGGTLVTSTAAELNILDGVTSTAAEINLIDGDTARGTTAVASGDGILVNDAGTMRMTNVDTVSTYFAGHSVGGANIVTTGALNSGSITSGFGTINIGSSAFTTTGTVNFGSLADGTITVTAFADEDDMTSDSATLVPTQQSVKAYVDSSVATAASKGFAIAAAIVFG